MNTIAGERPTKRPTISPEMAEILQRVTPDAERFAERERVRHQCKESPYNNTEERYEPLPPVQPRTYSDSDEEIGLLEWVIRIPIMLSFAVIIVIFGVPMAIIRLSGRVLSRGAH